MDEEPKEINRHEQACGAKASVWPSATHLSHSSRIQLSRMTNINPQRRTVEALNPIITYGKDKR